MATEHFGQPDWLSEFQEATNFFFVVLFTFEMLFKMYALGLSFYFIPLFNRFDFFVVITSILEMTLTMANVIPPLGMSVLRCIRLLRAFKVISMELLATWFPNPLAAGSVFFILTAIFLAKNCSLKT